MCNIFLYNFLYFGKCCHKYFESRDHKRVPENLNISFLNCPTYLQARTTLIDNINMVTTCYSSDIKFLTCGNVNLTKLYYI